MMRICYLQTAERDVIDLAAREHSRAVLGEIDETIRQVRDSLSPPRRTTDR